MNHPLRIVWFRQDLRVEDNPALAAASSTGDPVVPLFVLDNEGSDPWTPSAVSNRRERESLATLASKLEALGSKLVVREGNPQDVGQRWSGSVPHAQEQTESGCQVDQGFAMMG
jgi:deoxyribodipyrimidine photolyase